MTTQVPFPGFAEISSNDKQPLVANNLGRKALQLELVYLGGYFGEVKGYGGIADSADGRVNIDNERIIRTEQIEVTDTFRIGNPLWFVSGGAGAAGKLEDADPGSGIRLKVGIITGEGGSGGAQTYVEFRPFAQRLDSVDVEAQVETNKADIATNVTGISDNLTTIGNNATNIATNVSDINNIKGETKVLIFKLTVDAQTAPVVIAGLVEGDEIIGVSVICTVTSGAGTLIVEDGDANDITDAIACATDKVLVYASTLDDQYSTLPASGAKVLANGGSDRGILVITYIPA